LRTQKNRKKAASARDVREGEGPELRIWTPDRPSPDKKNAGRSLRRSKGNRNSTQKKRSASVHDVSAPADDLRGQRWHKRTTEEAHPHTTTEKKWENSGRGSGRRRQNSALRIKKGKMLTRDSFRKKKVDPILTQIRVVRIPKALSHYAKEEKDGAEAMGTGGQPQKTWSHLVVLIRWGKTRRGCDENLVVRPGSRAKQGKVQNKSMRPASGHQSLGQTKNEYPNAALGKREDQPGEGHRDKNDGIRLIRAQTLLNHPVGGSQDGTKLLSCQRKDSNVAFS